MEGRKVAGALSRGPGFTLVILTRMTVIELMFHLMRPALPALEAVTSSFAAAAAGGGRTKFVCPPYGP
ncbi:MAG: hypothetical protein ACRD2Z_01950 [Thermoanaerobaculia bacterium]